MCASDWFALLWRVYHPAVNADHGDLVECRIILDLRNPAVRQDSVDCLNQFRILSYIHQVFQYPLTQ